MAFPSLAQLCRQTAIANINQVTYIPSQLSTESIMSIMSNVGSSGALKVILANSPHLLDDPDQIDRLWKRFCEKEFGFLLKQKITQHAEEWADEIPFPCGSWEEVYDELAIEHINRIKADFEKAKASMRAHEKEKETKKTILVEDPRAIIKAGIRGQPGASFRPRAAVTPMQKIRERARLESFRRTQAMDKAKADIPISSKSQPSSSTPQQIIRKPSKSLSKRARGLEALRQQREASAKYQRRTASLSPEGAPAADQSADTKPAVESTPKAEISSPSARNKSTTSSATAPQKSTTTPTVGSVQKTPAPRLFQNPANKLTHAIKEKQIVQHKDGSRTTTTWYDWTKFHNRQIFGTFGRAEQDRLLAEKPEVVFTPAPGKNKRDFDAISPKNDDGAAADKGTIASSPPKDVASSPRPVKKPRGAAGVFMPARRR